MNEVSTAAKFMDEYDGIKSDLAHARQEILLLSGQLRDANSETEKMAYKVDFLTAEITRISASREQYERVAIRVSAKMEGAVAMMVSQLGDLHAEIRDAAFTKVPGAVPAPSPSDAIAEEINAVEVGKRFGAGFEAEPASVALLPSPKFGAGPR